MTSITTLFGNTLKTKLNSILYSGLPLSPQVGVIIKHIQPAHEIFQDGAFPCALPADDSYLRQVQVAALADGAERVLEFVDERNQIFHSPVPHSGTSAQRALLTSQSEDNATLGA